MDTLKWLENWYSSLCNGEWENYYGVKIDTLDNPGWIVEIDIVKTSLDGKQFDAILIDNGENDWVNCKVENGKFVGVGDKSKLSYIIDSFKSWCKLWAE